MQEPQPFAIQEAARLEQENSCVHGRFMVGGADEKRIRCHEVWNLLAPLIRGEPQSSRTSERLQVRIQINCTSGRACQRQGSHVMRASRTVRNIPLYSLIRRPGFDLMIRGRQEQTCHASTYHKATADTEQAPS